MTTPSTKVVSVITLEDRWVPRVVTKGEVVKIKTGLQRSGVNCRPNTPTEDTSIDNKEGSKNLL